MSSVDIARQRDGWGKYDGFSFSLEIWIRFLIIQLQEMCPSFVKLTINQLLQTFFPMFSLNCGKRVATDFGLPTALESNRLQMKFKKQDHMRYSRLGIVWLGFGFRFLSLANCKTQLYVMSYITTDSLTSMRPLIQFSQISKQSKQYNTHVRYIKIVT